MIRPLSIQFKLLIIFFVAAVIPIALVSLVSYHNSLKAVEEMVGNRTEILAQSVGDELDKKLKLRLRDRILLNNEPVQRFLRSVNEGDSEAQIAALMDLDAYATKISDQYNLYYKELILVDASGSPVYRVGRGKDGEFTLPGRGGRAAPPATLIDSLSALIPQELPLPRQLRRQVEQFSRSLQAQLDQEAEEKPPVEDEQVLPSEVVSAVIKAFSEPTPGETFNDPSFVGPQLPSNRSRNLLISLQNYLNPEQQFSEDEKLAARTGARLGKDENIVYIHRDDSGDPDAVRLLRPVYSYPEGEDRLGAMIQDLRVEYLFPEDLNSKQFGAQGELAVVDKNNGEILFHTASEFVGSNIRTTHPDLADLMRNPQEPSGPGKSWIQISSEDVDRLVSVFEVGTVGWSVVATAVPREFESEARGAGFINLLVATVALLLALGVLTFSSQRISMSIHKVTVGAREIATGNLTHTIRVDTHDEIETLADAFNSMTIALRENISLREKAASELAALNRTLEDRVQTRTQELVSVNEALNQANQELKDLDRLKSNFLATVSHEFRTPLTSITAFSEILIDEMDGNKKPPKEVLRFLSIINTESERLGRLIKNLLDLSRIEAGRMRWDRAVFPIREVMVASLDGLLPVFSEKDIRIIREVECPDTLISADRDRIQQVINNLLENAVKFSSKGNRIWVACKETSSPHNGTRWIQATIRDEGPGIPKSHLAMIFERFAQVDSTDTRGTGGSGLGLAISREIVEHHGGRIWAESSSGEGAAFHFTLPVSTGSAPDVSGSERAVKEKEHA